MEWTPAIAAACDAWITGNYGDDHPDNQLCPDCREDGNHHCPDCGACGCETGDADDCPECGNELLDDFVTSVYI